MPLQQTTGNVTADAFGGGVAAIPNYIEDVFSTYLWTGTGAANTINNGIDLAGSGGLTWIKSRSNSKDNALTDTVRGTNSQLMSDLTNAQQTNANMVTAFNSNGFTLGTDATNGWVNLSGLTYVGWTFRKQPKFFDIVTYTGNGSSNRQIAHSLGSTPGCFIVKCTSTTGDWPVYHQSYNGGVSPASYQTFLNLQTGFFGASSYFQDTSPTSTVFTVGNNAIVNASGQTYVAYLFASNSGGFGLTGTDNVISCGGYTGNGSLSGNPVTLGYEPQWLLVWRTDSTAQNWYLLDTMRGLSVAGVPQALYPNTSDAETAAATIFPTATGFNFANQAAFNQNGGTYVYVAIRRGPMKVPTDGTKVFSTNLETTTTNPQTLTTGFPVDLSINTLRSSTAQKYAIDRLRGTSTSSYQDLTTNRTNAEVTGTGGGLGFDNNTGIVDSTYWNNAAAIFWNFRRAPGFFDEVCYTGTGTFSGLINHNLGAVPEFVIFKDRSVVQNWWCYHSGLQYPASDGIILNSTGTPTSYYPTAVWGGTSTTFTTTNGFGTNTSGDNFVAYLFATCPGVSKVGSYTGNGTTQTINCGFTGGARFVLIKRTDAAGDWYTYDTARGMTVLTDPYLLLNSTAAEVATLGSVTTVSTGFALNSAILAAINVSAGTYIFLAIA